MTGVVDLNTSILEKNLIIRNRGKTGFWRPTSLKNCGTDPFLFLLLKGTMTVKGSQA